MRTRAHGALPILALLVAAPALASAPAFLRQAGSLGEGRGSAETVVELASALGGSQGSSLGAALDLRVGVASRVDYGLRIGWTHDTSPVCFPRCGAASRELTALFQARFTLLRAWSERFGLGAKLFGGTRVLSGPLLEVGAELAASLRFAGWGQGFATLGYGFTRLTRTVEGPDPEILQSEPPVPEQIVAAHTYARHSPRVAAGIELGAGRLRLLLGTTLQPTFELRSGQSRWRAGGILGAGTVFD